MALIQGSISFAVFANFFSFAKGLQEGGTGSPLARPSGWSGLTGVEGFMRWGAAGWPRWCRLHVLGCLGEGEVG